VRPAAGSPTASRLAALAGEQDLREREEGL
jgi:hypothetical protein